MSTSPDSWCFACGEENPIGLNLSFSETEGGVKAEFLPSREHQGYDGIIHGGIIATLLDESMVTLLNMQGIRAVTGRLNIRFKNPLKVGERVVVRAFFKDKRTSYFTLESEILNKETRDYVAVGKGLFLKNESKEE